MVNAEIRTLHEPDGTPVCNAAFDLSVDQVRAVALACAEIRTERHRGAALDTDAVIALRELTSVCDELDRLREAGGHATVVLPLARFAALHDALDEWVASRAQRGWLREDEQETMAIVDVLLAPMAALRAEGFRRTLEERPPVHGA